jgi:ABC-type phosphate transport system permease subunit
MAVIMIAENAVKLPHFPLDSVRTLTSNIALEMGYATGGHRDALFATGVMLLGIVIILNLAARFVTQGGAKEESETGP